MTRARLRELQRIPTSGARAVAPFIFDGVRGLAVPQLAVDLPGTPAGINGGSSDTEVLLFEETAEGFARSGSLPIGGGEDVEVFTIDDRTFLAVASIRTGTGDYDFATTSTVFERTDAGSAVHQDLPTYAAKQIRHFRIGAVDFLAIAQGMPGGDRTSVVMRWNGAVFEPLQDIPSIAGYNFGAFEIDGEAYLAHADHIAPSRLYRFDGDRFVEHQELLASGGGRAFLLLRDDEEHYLAVARIDADSVLLRWNGTSFVEASPIPGGPGGREFARVESDGKTYVLRVDFIHGSPAEPRPELDSHIYLFAGGALHPVGAFPTTGGTDVAVLPGDGLEVAVSNGLSGHPAPGSTFAAATVVYRFVAPTEDADA